MTDDPSDDVFDSDPFFAPDPGSEGDDRVLFESDAIPPDDVPVIRQDPVPAPATAEERLLNTIVGAPPASPAANTATPADAGELAALRAELESVLEAREEALAARDRARQDLIVLKTRVAALEADLASARQDTATATRLRTESESRHAQAERQWTEKFSQLRRMLDEVEVIRDELNNKRVPKILFVGTLVAGLLATAFAYFIGSGRAAGAPELPAAAPSPAIAPVASRLPEPVAPATTAVTPPTSVPTPALAPEPQPIAAPPGAASRASLPPRAPAVPPKPATRATPAPAVRWPALASDRVTVKPSGSEMTVVFNNGVFAEGAELAPEARQDLKAIATAIKARGSSFRVEVEGHTDDVKTRKGKAGTVDNMKVGLSRAKAVAAFLTSQGGLPAGRITTTSTGEANPPFPNTTEANRKKNRTVVLKIRPL